jgi:beta propeller repeat protein
LPCTVSIPAANTGPGAQGEYRVSLTTPIFVVAGRGVPQSLAAGSGASEIVYFDGTDFVDRLLTPPLERRTPANLSGMPGVPAGTSSAMSDLWSNMSDGRVAVMLPFTPPAGLPTGRDLAVLDMVRCEVRPTGADVRLDGTMTWNFALTEATYSGDLLAFSRFHYDGLFGGTRALDVRVLDTTSMASSPNRMVPVYLTSAKLFANPIPSPAVSDQLVALTRMAAISASDCEIFWQTFAGASGTIPQITCTQAIVADAGRIAWSDGHVWLFDTGTGTLSQLTTQSSRQQNPSLRGRLVAYEDDRGGDLDIYALDLTTGVESPVFVGPGDQHLVGIVRDGIVWWSATADGIGVFWNPTFTPATTAAQ